MLQKDLIITKTTIYKHVFEESDENGFFSFGYQFRDPGETICFSGSDSCYHLHVVLAGTGFFTAQGELHPTPLHPTMVFQQYPHQESKLIVALEQHFVDYEICIGEYAYRSLKAFGLLSEKDIVFPLDLLPHLEKWMKHILFDATLNNPDPSELFFNIQKLTIALHQQNLLTESRTIHSMVESAKQVLCSDYRKQISLDEVAESFDLSYEKFRKIFKDKIGISPLQFRLQCKFYYAQSLLSAGCSIKETAGMTGYQDPFIFSRQFKKYIGNPPSYYKKGKKTITDIS